MSEQIVSLGSKWCKFDFHTHTPLSNDYGRGEVLFKNTKPEEWLQKAMVSCIECVFLIL